MTATVYVARDGRGSVLYVGCTTDMPRRMIDHKSNSKWYCRATEIVGEEYASLDEARDAEKRTIEELAPPFNVHHAGHHHKRPTNHRQQLAAIILGRPLAEYVAAKRSEGMGWRRLAARPRRRHRRSRAGQLRDAPQLVRRGGRMTATALAEPPCTCTEHAHYRQLDRACPQHGDEAENRRRNP